MDPILFTIAGFVAFGAVGSIAILARKKAVLALLNRQQETKIQMLQSAFDSLTHEKVSLLSEQKELNFQNRDLSSKLGAAAADLRNLESRLQDQKKQFERTSEQMLNQFEVLSSRILDTQSEKFVKSNHANLQTVLAPLKDHLQVFQKKVEDTHLQDVRDRSILEEQIKSLAAANGHLIAEANNLARALKGSAKSQGNWGEIMLERILESAGLREGHEFIREGSGMALQSEEGKAQRPDVVLNLPDDKHIVIDSKVSLVAYERFVNFELEDEKDRAIKDHIESIERHVTQLAGKHYSKNKALNAPDFVLMFMPVESALSCAYLVKPELFQFAWAKGIIIASPTTLIATAQTVASIWRMENQNLNALKIAEQGARLYDKFAGFVDDMEQTRKSLDTLEKNFDSAMSKLSEGKGNLISSAEKLKSLGVTTKKKLKSKYVEQDDETETPRLIGASSSPALNASEPPHFPET